MNEAQIAALKRGTQEIVEAYDRGYQHALDGVLRLINAVATPDDIPAGIEALRSVPRLAIQEAHKPRDRTS